MCESVREGESEQERVGGRHRVSDGVCESVREGENEQDRVGGRHRVSGQVDWWVDDWMSHSVLHFSSTRSVMNLSRDDEYQTYCKHCHRFHIDSVHQNFCPCFCETVGDGDRFFPENNIFGMKLISIYS